MVSAAALTWNAFLMGLAAAKYIGQGKIICKRYKMASLVIMGPKDLVTIKLDNCNLTICHIQMIYKSNVRAICISITSYHFNSASLHVSSVQN